VVDEARRLDGAALWGIPHPADSDPGPRPVGGRPGPDPEFRWLQGGSSSLPFYNHWLLFARRSC